MSDVVPRYGGRGGRWEFGYGPGTYGEIMEDYDSDEGLPSVDYENIAYDEWTIKMSLKFDGLSEEFWEGKLSLRNGPLLRVVENVLTYDTLLYRMVLSRSAHDEFDRGIAYLYYGYLKEIMESGELLVLFEVSVELVWDIARWGAYFIMCPYYEYEVIELDGNGYYSRREDDSDREIEP